MPRTGYSLYCSTKLGNFEGRKAMVILGIILLIIGLLANISILVTLGAIIAVVGLVLNFIPMGGSRRRVY